MLSDELAEKIRKGIVKSVNITATSEDMLKSCSIFDAKVGTLCRILKEQVKNIEFSFYSRTENYKILIPTPMSDAEALIKLLKSTSLAITEKY